MATGFDELRRGGRCLGPLKRRPHTPAKIAASSLFWLSCVTRFPRCQLPDLEADAWFRIPWTGQNSPPMKATACGESHGQGQAENRKASAEKRARRD